MLPVETGIQSALQDATTFLNLTTSTSTTSTTMNFTTTTTTSTKIANRQRKKKVPFANETYQLLYNFYQPYNERLVQFMKKQHREQLQSDETIQAVEAYVL